MPAGRGRVRLLIAIALVLTTCAIYGRVIGHAFLVYDDEEYVTANPEVLKGLTPAGIVWAFTSIENYNWHPLTWIAHMVDVNVWGPWSGGHHLSSVLLHALNALLLFLALEGMTGRRGASAFVAALFAVHPLHVESVAWLAERKDVLSGTFWILTILAYARYARRPSWGRYCGCLLLFAAGLMAKPMLVSLPIVLLLLDAWPLARWRPASAGLDTAREPAGVSRRSGKGRVSAHQPPVAVPFSRVSARGLFVEKLPFLALSAASGAITIIAQESGGAISSLERLPFTVRAANAATSTVLYIAKTFWPQPLAVFYPHHGGRLASPATIGAILLLCVVSAIALHQARRRPWLATGWFLYTVTLLPVVGLVQVGPQAMADRYTYLPLIGIFIVLAYGVPDLFSSWSGSARILRGSALVVVAAMAFLAWKQIGVWRDSETLFRHALVTTKGNWLAHNNLGVVLYRAGEHAQAEEHFRASVALNPLNRDAFRNLGEALVQGGRLDEAVAAFSEAIRLHPEDPAAHYDLGVAHLRRGDRKRAIDSFRESLRIRPDDPMALNNLGGCLIEEGRTEEATLTLRRAIELDPRDVRARVNLGLALVQLGLREEAVGQFREALRIDPQHGEARRQLDRALGSRLPP
jgi:Flp pilus assembly protein TadD